MLGDIYYHSCGCRVYLDFIRYIKEYAYTGHLAPGRQIGIRRSYKNVRKS